MFYFWEMRSARFHTGTVAQCPEDISGEYISLLVAGEGFEPSKAEPGDLQSPPIGRSGNPPGLSVKQRT